MVEIVTRIALERVKKEQEVWEKANKTEDESEEDDIEDEE